MYMHEAIYFISVAATEIPENHLLWHSDDATHTARGKHGILEQLGRMLVQDHSSETDCIYIANLAIAALKAGHTSREIEKAIRAIRLAWKSFRASPDNEQLRSQMWEAVTALENLSNV